ncbi:MAG: NADPH-dependent glutamate synthase beta subunit-like oxidoreductase/NAD(P)H-flavin reductase [Candidatus Midichloriaceae bacterium]|jgi:NADPH-dependent glutamate synthase beta subunit-like oxidoreductase/NAD(P)H-flavin reductase
MVELGFGIKFEDLYSDVGLKKIDDLFLNYLDSSDFISQKELISIRREGALSSEALLKLSIALEEFFIELFKIKDQINISRDRHKKVNLIFQCRRKFIQRKVNEESQDKNRVEEARIKLEKYGIDINDEISFSENVLKWIENEDEEKLYEAKIYASWAVLSKEGSEKYKDGMLFKIPQKTDYYNLIKYSVKDDGTKYFEQSNIRKRCGFDHTDDALTDINSITNANYCIYCHKQKKDSCSKGLVEKETEKIQKNPLNVSLDGCPLGQKISEMNYLKKEGFVLAAFAVAVKDNPMIAATGHRICNDCMKSCIYQKQKPVDIPLIETQILDEILHLNYGFEIYSLLTKWNPLKEIDFLPSIQNNKKILVVGLGPAGFTLSHYLTNQGFTVVAIDGLKIEPINSKFSGIDELGDRKEFIPIKNISDIEEKLSLRKAYGFGGVAEYGITVRWNKNYLKIIRLILERRGDFRIYGSVRFGSAITYNNAKTLGFDHIALAVGAGKPNIPQMPNIFMKGVRAASDFLMALQLQTVYRKDVMANLQIRLPMVIIGGGLTSIDAATECLAYYPIMVEKFLKFYENADENFFESIGEEDKEIASEFICHAKELRSNPQNKLSLIKSWGGVKVIYRKKIEESPAYKLNHEELEKAFEEGIEVMDEVSPISVEVDKFDNVSKLICEDKVFSVKNILIATGTSPNSTLSREYPDQFQLDGKFFKLEGGNKKDQFFTKIDKDFSVSILGDAHPQYSGSVVKAMASAKNASKKITDLVLSYPNREIGDAKSFYSKLDDLLISKIVDVNRLADNVVELTIYSPLAAEEFKPGQFYRLQNFENNSRIEKGFKLTTEPLALTGAWVDKANGLISLIILEMGGSSDFCKYMKKGEVISLMGPTGSPTYIPKNKNVILIGGGLGNAVLFSIGKAMRENGCNVLYFSGYKKKSDVFKVKEIEDAADKVVWCCDEGLLKPDREQDKACFGNIVNALERYDDELKASEDLELRKYDHLLTIGSDSLMKAVSYVVYNELKNLFNAEIKAYASINSPMQCMMKEICAQCLQKHIDPVSKEVSYVYSCFNQDQDLNKVDFNHLSCRLKQNSLFENMAKKIIGA